MLAFPFVGFEFLCFFFLPLLLLFHKSSCYVLVSVFCCFGFPGFACVLCVVFFWFVFGFFCLFCFGGFKGQSRWPKGPPQLTLNPLCLFCFVFVLFLFVFF